MSLTCPAALGFAVVLAMVVDVAGGTGWDLAGLDATHLARRWNLPEFSAKGSGPGHLSGLRQVPASSEGASLAPIPVFGATTVFPVGERFEPWQWFGAAVIVNTTAFIAGHVTTFAQPSPRE